jgi:hypothetical protein
VCVSRCVWWGSGQVREWKLGSPRQEMADTGRQTQAGSPCKRTLSWKREARHRKASSTPPDLTRSMTCSDSRSGSSGAPGRPWARASEVGPDSCQPGEKPSHAPSHTHNTRHA